ncbi:MAG TPA: hypothetical protein VFM34_11210 [Moraxellaceae bacterium]|nr:hypothetical protein [Moraxellaceae bacterium]
MENQHRKISGYRELSQEEIDLINRIKAFGPQLRQLVKDIEEHVVLQNEMAAKEACVRICADDNGDDPELSRLYDANPHGWIWTGSNHLQQGLMALTRAVAQPTEF